MMLSVVCRWAGNGYLMRWPARPVALVACADGSTGLGAVMIWSWRWWRAIAAV
jgi:hypothetical protein